MGDRLTKKQPKRAADLAGDPRRAAELRDQAEQIYNDLEARYAGQPGAQSQGQGQRIDTNAR